MIRVRFRACCECGWEHLADAEVAAEVEGEAHLSCVWRARAWYAKPAEWLRRHLVTVQKVRTWEEGDAEHLG